MAQLVRVRDPAAALALEVAAGGKLFQVGGWWHTCGAVQSSSRRRQVPAGLGRSGCLPALAALANPRLQAGRVCAVAGSR